VSTDANTGEVYTIYGLIDRLPTSEGLYKLAWLLTQKANNPQLSPRHMTILMCAHIAQDKAKQLLAMELNHTMDTWDFAWKHQNAECQANSVAMLEAMMEDEKEFDANAHSLDDDALRDDNTRFREAMIQSMQAKANANDALQRELKWDIQALNLDYPQEQCNKRKVVGHHDYADNTGTGGATKPAAYTGTAGQDCVGHRGLWSFASPTTYSCGLERQNPRQETTRTTRNSVDRGRGDTEATGWHRQSRWEADCREAKKTNTKIRQIHVHHPDNVHHHSTKEGRGRKQHMGERKHGC
jgi:hypothetical protein